MSTVNAQHHRESSNKVPRGDDGSQFCVLEIYNELSDISETSIQEQSISHE